MGGLSNIDAVFMAMVFFVPGYVYLVVRSQIIPGYRIKSMDSPIRLLSISTLNFAIWGWAVYLVLGSDKLPYWTHPVAWTFAILIGPIIVSITSIKIENSKAIDRLYGWIGCKRIHQTPGSWDYIFSRRDPSYIIVELDDGTIYAGWWGVDSFASSDPEERDIYIEKVYVIGDKKNVHWKEVGKSVLLVGKHIKYIEFID